MYLKEIEVSGFKSFADKISINLDNEITCIVGPNGSGKSNVIDAIRFVLGEQSVKSLRGDNLMSDVIFSGSKDRNPMHAASVCLTFNNEDNYLKVPFNQVTVKRRLYKTGENEYFLNGEKCRLKDIVDLFLDSGMGRDSFNIINQGDISKLLSNSPSDRRVVIEEAAGILKYKKRREEAFKKLDKTNDNLDRVNDIITEVENRVLPLKEQSEKATVYLDLKEKLKKLEISVLVSEITSINKEYLSKKNLINSLNNEILSLSSKVNNPEIDEYKLKLIELEKKYQELNEEILKISKIKEELNSKKIIIEEKIKYQTNDLENLDKKKYLDNKKYNLEKEISVLEANLVNNRQEKNELDTKISKLFDRLNSLKLKLENNHKEYNTKSKENLNNINKLEILKNNISENLYLNSNVKRVLDSNIYGVHDALINIIKTTDKYQKCLDIITQTNKNFIIVDNSNVANKTISYLKENNLGRITFLPLDVIKEKRVDYETLGLIMGKNGYLGKLSDFLEYDNKYSNIVLNQFGNIIVVDNLENATYISKVISNRYRVLTLDGDIIHVGGSITGGSFNNKSINNTKNQILDLETTISIEKDLLTSIENESIKLDEEINSLDKEIYSLRTNLINIIDLIKSDSEKINRNKQELDTILLEIKSFNKNDIELELDTLNEEYYKESLKYDLIYDELNKVSKNKSNLQDIILEKEGINKIYNNNLKEKEKELKENEILVNNLSNKLDNNLNILNQEYTMTYESAVRDYLLDYDINEARDDVKNYKNKIRNLGDVNVLAIDEYKEVSSRYEFLTNERNDLLKAKDMLFTLIDEMDDVMKQDFLNTFKELQVEFKNVFRSLFKGGDANLSLTDPDNLLETGVDITACPPGKKLKTISLLSGGEKTLTAISLLFAILNIRSVPFCIFDEIEAALDEANVDNFGNYLHSYKDKTQFLLITHKKRTMEYANTLYGITMQESGVSKLVSVKLENN